MEEARNVAVRFPSKDAAIAGVLFLPPTISARVPVMIVCHGAFEFKENHFALCEYLAGEGIAGLAMDMHGHGESQGARWHVEMEEWVSDIRGAVDFLAGHPAVDGARIGAFGFSSGGTAVLEAAIVEPRLKALVTLSATVRDVAGPQAAACRLLVALGRASIAVRGRGIRVSFASALPGVHFAFDPRANRAIARDPRVREAYQAIPFPGSAECYFTDTLERAQAVAAPCLVLHGAEDRVDPPQTARLLFDRLRCEKRLELIPRSGHAAHLDAERARVFQSTAAWARTHL